MSELTINIATIDDCTKIADLMELSIVQLQKGYLNAAQIRASRAGMGLDTQLIKDKTYFSIWDGEVLVGCGGWSRRATLHGGDHSADRDDRLLDPATERARIRAMYTHPDHIRRGIGRMIIDASEQAARAEGFKVLEMAATVAGQPFYKKCGYHIESVWDDMHGEVPVPLATMVKTIA